MRISDWSSDVCSSDLGAAQLGQTLERLLAAADRVADRALRVEFGDFADVGAGDEALRLARTQHQPLRRVQREPLEQRPQLDRSEEHTSELQTLMRIAYADFR